MAAPQNAVKRYYARGVDGDQASINYPVYTPENYICAEEIRINSFVWLNEDKQLVQSGTGLPWGYAWRVHQYYISDLSADAVFTAQAGEHMSTLIHTDGIHTHNQSDTAAEIGMAIFVNNSDGKDFIPAAPGSNQAGYTETWFRVVAVSGDNDWDTEDSDWMKISGYNPVVASSGGGGGGAAGLTGVTYNGTAATVSNGVAAIVGAPVNAEANVIDSITYDGTPVPVADKTATITSA